MFELKEQEEEIWDGPEIVFEQLEHLMAVVDVYKTFPEIKKIRIIRGRWKSWEVAILLGPPFWKPEINWKHTSSSKEFEESIDFYWQ